MTTPSKSLTISPIISASLPWGVDLRASRTSSYFLLYTIRIALPSLPISRRSRPRNSAAILTSSLTGIELSLMNIPKPDPSAISLRAEARPPLIGSFASATPPIESSFDHFIQWLYII
jgi:hypothetical protein